MASVVDELNHLLARERGEVEALNAVVGHLDRSDPDLARGARDLMGTASWSCSGLYHRINHLHGVPSLDASDLAARVIDEVGTRQKIAMVCKARKQDAQAVKSLLKRDDVDEATRSFLEDMLHADARSAGWCQSTLAEFERDI